MLSTDKLKNKEVINISDGRSLGFVSDIEVNLEKGAIEGIIIPAERGLFSWFHKGEEDRMIRWENVRTVGDDVILVDAGQLRPPQRQAAAEQYGETAENAGRGKAPGRRSGKRRHRQKAV